MRLPFFRSSKTETRQPLNLVTSPPRPGTVVPRLGPRREATTRILHDTLPIDIPDALSATVTATAEDSGGNYGIPLSVQAILSQLPAGIFASGSEPLLAQTTIALPVNLVLPQLSKGKVLVCLSDLIGLLPADLLRYPLPVMSPQQTVVLPLAELVAAIPADLFKVEQELKANASPELDQVPNLFDDSLLQEPVTEDSPSLESVSCPEPAAPPAVAETPTVTDIQQTTAAEVQPNTIKVSLRSLVAVMPDRVFSAPRAQLSRTVDMDMRVELPLEPMLDQLKTARVALPLSMVIKAMPPSLFVCPLPQISGETVPVPLNEIVPQLPPDVFGSFMTPPQTNQCGLESNEIPNPFRERDAKVFEMEAVLAAELDQPVQPAAEPVEAECGPVFAEQAPSVEPPAAEPEPVLEVHAEVPAEPPVPSVEIAAQAAPVEQPAPLPETEPVKEIESPSATVQQTQPPRETTVADDAGFLVNLNRCSREDLRKFKGVGPALAERIIEFRTTHGPFKSLKDLRQVPGIGRKTFRALAGSEPRELNCLLGVTHNEELTLQEIVRLTNALPGVGGCILAMADGVFLTGQLPSHLDCNTVSVFAPQLFKKVSRYVRELKVGRVSRFTIFTDQQPVSIFQAGDVYLIVVHQAHRYSKALLRRCERISQEIARLCRQRATV